MIDYTDVQVQVAITVKLNEIQCDNLPRLTYQNLVDVLEKSIWVKKRPGSLHEAINDILSLTADKIVQILLTLAVVDGYNQNFSEFDDILRRKK